MTERKVESVIRIMLRQKYAPEDKGSTCVVTCVCVFCVCVRSVVVVKK